MARLCARAQQRVQRARSTCVMNLWQIAVMGIGTMRTHRRTKEKPLRPRCRRLTLRRC
jgi:hypothetical protein